MDLNSKESIVKKAKLHPIQFEKHIFPVKVPFVLALRVFFLIYFSMFSTNYQINWYRSTNIMIDKTAM